MKNVFVKVLLIVAVLGMLTGIMVAASDKTDPIVIQQTPIVEEVK